MQPGLLTSEAWQKCPFTYTNYEGKNDGEASQNASCYFCLAFSPTVEIVVKLVWLRYKVVKHGDGLWFGEVWSQADGEVVLCGPTGFGLS